ncbi:MAG: helix-turn-helix transcriptional regulator [Anaerolineae bacterium]
MPQRRQRWQGGQGGRACPRRIHRFLEPCLMLLLHHGESYGYELVEGIKQFGFEQVPADLSTVYRVLRSLEDQGLVASRWDTEGTGPARRLYRITDEGNQFLAWWVEDLRETDRMLHYFLTAYDLHMAAHE